ncbi:hypothetical protein [Actinokineospora iranica]|uniref:Uncharacterized protein n=1 Tax=Actinokineospora iranica TaxID=1271860 RepID=A0A1G6S178_9PSEU|nr:hypothetical protein [Actinokineospora iranica]SDD10434.1 hypothetical protein SAMN05216174_107150 [Actinokineospora iranica]
MTEQERQALRHVAAGQLLYHTGLWGGPAGYRWRGQDGSEAGVVSPWETQALYSLTSGGLIAVEARTDPFARRVRITAAGMSMLGELAQAA